MHYNEMRKRHVRAQLVKHADTYYLENWGRSKDQNILYITGISGSGKSTLALCMADDFTEIIHLDAYFELDNLASAQRFHNKVFDDFLKSKRFDPFSLNNKDLFVSNKKEYFRLVDLFAAHSENFGEHLYHVGVKVIMEGLQLLDETMYPDKDFFDNKPRIELTTKSSVAARRARKRDRNIN